jgi:hypothetical protein
MYGGLTSSGMVFIQISMKMLQSAEHISSEKMLGHNVSAG